MNTTRKFVLDTGWAMSSSLIAIGVGFSLNLIIGNYMGPEGLGIFSMSLAIYTITATIGALGVHSALVKYAAEFQDDPSELNTLTSAAVLISAALGLVSCGVLLLLSTSLSNLYGMSDLRPMLRIFALGLPFFLMNKTLLGLLNGLRALRAYALFESLRYMGAIILTLVLTLYMRIGLLGIAWAITGAEIFVCAMLWYRVRPNFSFRLSDLHKQSSRLLHFGVQVQLSGMIGEINTYVALFVAGFFLSETEIGIYALALMFVRGFLIIPSAVQKITNPAISYLHSKKLENVVTTLTRDAMKYSSFLLCLVSIAVVLFGKDLISFLYPQQPTFLAAEPPLRIMMVGVMLYGAVVAVGATPSSLGRPGLSVLVAAQALILNIVLNLMLVPQFGINGLAYATAGVFCLSTLFMMVILKWVLRIDIGVSQLALTFALGLGAYLLAFLIAPSLGQLATGLLVAGTYLSVLVLSGILNRKDLARILSLLNR